MPGLPLKVQLGIRDHWDKEDGALQKSLRGLKDLFGQDVVVEPEWKLLLAELDKFYEDKSNFVATVARCVETWCKSMSELLEDEANEEWTEAVLEKLKTWSCLRLLLDVASSDQASTSWSEERTSFVLSLPKKTVYQATEFYPLFRDSLLNCFKEDKTAAIPHRDATAVDDWADVEMDKSTGTAAVIEKQPRTTDRPVSRLYSVEFLPTAASLTRPDDLLLRPPYHLIVYDHGRQKIEVHCSHSPSLQLLSEYLKRWCRSNHNDTRNPPAVQVNLEQSPWGLGMMYDRLVLTTEETRYTKQFTVNACIVLALIEGVLGYEKVSVNSGQWTYRRDSAFKNL